MKHVNKLVGEAITARREHLGWSKAEVARRMPCSPAAVLYWETGHRSIPIATLYRLAAVLNVPPFDLLPGEAAEVSR